MSVDPAGEATCLKKHWDSVYARTVAHELSWYQSRPEVSLRLIREAGLPRQATLLDVGGGASTLVDALIEDGFGDVTVLDLSERALATARERLGERADAARWIAADVLKFRPSRSYRVWHDRAVFHFMTSAEERRAYLDTLNASLADDGVAILGTFALGGPERCSGLPVERYNANKLMRTLSEAYELVSAASETHVTPWSSAQRFAYFVVRRRPERMRQ